MGKTKDPAIIPKGNGKLLPPQEEKLPVAQAKWLRSRRAGLGKYRLQQINLTIFQSSTRAKLISEEDVFKTSIIFDSVQFGVKK